ncbi:unnamed protein product [Peronospora effusa]|nr:unnamed protein product [Peronospora effusa]
MVNSKFRKDVSVGEYDLVTGLTYITHQRGRLLFNMGASAKKQKRQESDLKRIPPTPTLSTGTFTGLSLYPEEAHYLMQRDALVIYFMSVGNKDARELSIADFTAILARDTRVSLPCLEVYTFLKDQQLHPRRCLEPLTESTGSEDGRSVPRDIKETEFYDVAFDVWRTVAVDDLLSADDGEQATQVSGTVTMKGKKLKQKKKKLMLVFRVAVARYSDAALSPQSFRQVLSRSKARDCRSSSCRTSVSSNHLPVKVAVVHHDQSVLMFEISE